MVPVQIPLPRLPAAFWSFLKMYTLSDQGSPVQYLGEPLGMVIEQRKPACPSAEGFRPLLCVSSWRPKQLLLLLQLSGLLFPRWLRKGHHPVAGSLSVLAPVPVAGLDMFWISSWMSQGRLHFLLVLQQGQELFLFKKKTLIFFHSGSTSNVNRFTSESPGLHEHATQEPVWHG